MKRQILIIPLLLTLVLSGCGNKPIANKQTPEGSKNSEINVVTKEDLKPEGSNVETTKPAPKNNQTTEQNNSDKPVKTPPKVETNNLKTSEISWYYVPKTDGTPSGAPKEATDLLKKYNGYYLGDTSKKIIYLTFDEGYENGYSAKILDILKENNVKAAFFVTNPYIKSNTALIKRMVDEGHLVCNHSTTHPSMASIKDKDAFNKEFTTVENTFTSVTGKTMPKYFRPPMGKYSELSMAYTSNLGYKTIFWSFAYNDWDPAKQPEKEYAKKVIMQRTHNGGIFLLHAVSKTNTEILDYLIKEWKNQGFEFKALTDLP